MLKLFKRFKGKDWIFISILVAIFFFNVYFDVTLADYTEKIINQARSMLGVSEILITGIIMLCYVLLSMICAIAIGYIATFLAAKFSRDLRADLFKKVQAFSLEEMNKFSVNSLITRSTNDIQQVCMAIMMILKMAVYAPISAIWALIKIRSNSGQMTVATALWISFLITVLSVVFIFALPKFKIIQKMTDKLNSVTRENLTGLKVVKAYNADVYEQEKFEKVNKGLTRINLYVNRVMAIMQPVMILTLGGISLTIYWLSAYLINQSALDIGAMFSFSQLTMRVLMSFMMLLMLFIIVPRASVSAKRINEVLESKITILNPLKEQNFKSVGEVEFKNVSFKYPEAEGYILKDISFKVDRGQTVALIGSTGSGKSTLINLVPRFYDVSEGEVLVNGINVKDVNQSTLRQKIGYVSQRGILFSDTVESNICYGCQSINKEEILKASQNAMASDFINKMENKYDSDISQGGKNVSGGQKQRLSIARALAINPEIMIFDDSFSALDFKTDKIVRENLRKNYANVTKLIIAQRIGTILDADIIIVLENGCMIGQGTHKELLQSCKVYREIALSQLKAEELGLYE